MVRGGIEIIEPPKSEKHQRKKCPNCGSKSYGTQRITRGDPNLTATQFRLKLCRNCGYQPYSNMAGLV